MQFSRVTPVTTVDPVGASQELLDDISAMIDMEAFAAILREEVVTSPLVPVAPTTPVPAETPTTPATPVASLDIAEVHVSVDIIRNCITQRKVQAVRETLEAETKRHRCAIKLLNHFFNKEELTKSNTDGSHGKEHLLSVSYPSIFTCLTDKH